MSINSSFYESNYENKSKQILIENGQYDVLPIDIVALLKKNDFVIQQMDLPSKTTGLIIVNDEEEIGDTHINRLIVVSKLKNYLQSRFIVAHEYAHFVLHKKTDQPLFAHRDLDGHETTILEKEAECLARCLLMPQELVLSKLYSVNNKYNENEKISFIANEFRVTDAKAKVRLADKPFETVM
jgi:Zn-dependent peptidase ImmA (M78 family)